jgi:hypothetical protein
MSGAFVQLEEVDERLRGKRILTYLPGSETPKVLNYIRLMVSNVQAGGEPFMRIICVTNSSVYRAYADGLGATLIVGPRDNTDWSLILTACTAHPSTLIVVFPDCKAPDALLGRLPAASTLIQFRGLEEAWTSRLYGFYFFPHVADMAGSDADLVIKRVTELQHSVPDLRSVLKELRMAGAGLALAGNTLHWWDAKEEVPGLRRRPEVTAALLHFLADTVA